MSSKEQSHSNDKTNSKQEVARGTTENIDVLAQQQTSSNLSVQRAKIAPQSLTPRDVLHLQRKIGNRATGRLLTGTKPGEQSKPNINPAGDQYQHVTEEVAQPTLNLPLPVQRDEGEAKTVNFVEKNATVIQRELTKAYFIDETTWGKFLWIWRIRTGNKAVRDAVEAALETFEQSEQTVKDLEVLRQRLFDERGKLDLGDSLGSVIGSLMNEVKQEIEKKGGAASVINLDDYPTAKALIAGIDLKADEATKLTALKDNFAAINWFEYRMEGGGLTELLKGTAKTGDCRTLSLAFQWVAQNALGVAKVDIGYEGKEYLVQDGGRVLDKTVLTGNVDGGRHWRFTSHSWVITSIGEIDVLFRGQAVDKSNWKYLSKTGETEGKSWREYENGTRIYRWTISGSIPNRYTEDFEKAIVSSFD